MPTRQENIAATAHRQWFYMGPQTITHNGRKYKYNGKMALRDGPDVLERYNARRRKGESIADGISVRVHYCEGSDTYTLTWQAFTGMGDVTAKRTVEYVMPDMYRNYESIDPLRG